MPLTRGAQGVITTVEWFASLSHGWSTRWTHTKIICVFRFEQLNGMNITIMGHNAPISISVQMSPVCVWIMPPYLALNPSNIVKYWCKYLAITVILSHSSYIIGHESGKYLIVHYLWFRLNSVNYENVKFRTIIKYNDNLERYDNSIYFRLFFF